MRQRAAAAIAALGLAFVLLVNFRAPEDAALVGAIQKSSTGSSAGSGSATTGRTSTGTVGGTGSGRSTGGSAATPAPAGSGSTGSGTGSTASGTFMGQDIQMPYGDVQVQITVKDGKIVDVKALALPAGGHSGRISSFVAPILRGQALTAQSASIDGVSGATYTSESYAASLQSALDAAGM